MELSRTRIDALAQVLGHGEFIDLLKGSENPIKELMENEFIVDAINSSIWDTSSGKAGDELCQWLYETYQTGDLQYQAVVLRYMPAVCGVYFSRASSDNDEPLAGFEAVLLALFTEESKARGGRPLLVHLPSLSQPSLYHTPKPATRSQGAPQEQLRAEQVCAPLEPQTAVKSTKRATIVGLALELFCRKISYMPVKAKLEICEVVIRWTVMGCSWASQVDEIAKLALPPAESVQPAPEGVHDSAVGFALASGEAVSVTQAALDQPPHQRTVGEGKAALMDGASSDAAFSSAPGSVSFNSATSSIEKEQDEPAVKLALPLDLLRPVFRILGHCLLSPFTSADVQEAAASAARALYVRSSQDLVPEAILASRSLVRLDAHASANGSPHIRSSSSSISATSGPTTSNLFMIPS